MSGRIDRFEDLHAYQACREFRVFAACEIIPAILEKKEFDLANQLKRSSRSVTANIAEGFGRFHYMDNYKFCSNARGSLNESLEHFIAANDEYLISDELLALGREAFEKAHGLLNGYMAHLQRSAKDSK